MMHHAGLTQLSGADYTPLALMNFDANAIFVRADSPIKSAKELLDAARANPGKLKASGTGQGGIWHLGLAHGWSTTSCRATPSPGCRARARHRGCRT